MNVRGVAIFLQDVRFHFRDHRGGRGGGPIGFHRAPDGVGRGGNRGGQRGGGGGGHPSVRGGGEQQQRGGSRGGRGSFVPGRPTQTKKEPLKFDSEYDFDAANEEFAEVMGNFTLCRGQLQWETQCATLPDVFSVPRIKIPSPPRRVGGRAQDSGFDLIILKSSPEPGQDEKYESEIN